MSFINPTVANFKTQFTRDFPYSTDFNLGVTDDDIGNAFNMLTNIGIGISNQDLYPSQSAYNTAFLFLAAHYLVLNLRNASQGINGQYNWIQNSKAVQGVSESFTVPEKFTQNALLAQFVKTNYGSMWLNFVEPYLVGFMFTGFAPARAL